MDIISNLKNQVIISVQASPLEPLYNEKCLIAMMQSVINGGAKALRLAGVRDISNAKKMFNVPIIGLTKPEKLPDNWKDVVYITPTVADAEKIIAAGADVVAFDATLRTRTQNSLEELVGFIKNAKRFTMADIATFEEGVNAEFLGIDLISTTLSGYTQNSGVTNDEPDFELLEKLVTHLKTPIILEGRIWEREQIKKAFDIGAHAVVIGSAVTRPQLITKRFLDWK